jgi:hypothetical protein
MKIGKIILKSSLAIFILIAIVGGFFTYLDVKLNRDCEILMDISKDAVLSNNIWEQLSFYHDKPTYLSKIGRSSGVVYVEELDNEININWEKIGIPKRHATIEIRGNNINYAAIDPEKVNEIRIGFGYRSHLVYKINQRVDAHSDQYEMVVDCKE